MAGAGTSVQLLQHLETEILAAPSLGVNLSNQLIGSTSDPAAQAHMAVHIRLVSSENLEWGKSRTYEYFEDTVEIELLYRLAPKNQRGSRDLALALVDSIRNRITKATNTTVRAWRPKHESDEHEIDGGWIRTVQTYTFKRCQTLGGG